MNELITQIDAGAGLPGDILASTAHFPEEWFFEAMSGGWGRSETGEYVNPRTAMGHGPVWQAINTLAADVGQLPIHVTRDDGRKIIRYDTHPVEWLLAHEPNKYQTPAVWKETMMAWCAAWGNSCSWIVRDSAGRPVMLVPLLPDRTAPLDVDGEWWIETDFGDGRRIPLAYDDVFHLSWLADDGFWGIGPIQACRNVVAGGLAIRRHGNRTFANGGRPGGALEIPGPMPTPEQMRERRAQLEAQHGGTENAGKWLLLYNGTKFTQLSMNNQDAQWLEAMDLDREFIASIFNLPPYKLGSMKNSSTRANTNQQESDYRRSHLMRHLNKFREQIRRKLFSFRERTMMKVDVDWVYEANLRADLAARGAYYSQAKTGEWMTTNEIRKIEGLDPVPGGDEIRNPAINPAQPKQPGTEPTKREPSPEPAAPDEAIEAARALIRDRADAMLDAEANRIEKVAKGSRPFLPWADEFYQGYADHASTYLRIACKLATSLGLSCNWQRAAELHARDSLAVLKGITGMVGQKDLPAAVADHVDRVRALGSMLTNSILGAAK